MPQHTKHILSRLRHGWHHTDVNEHVDAAYASTYTVGVTASTITSVTSMPTIGGFILSLGWNYIDAIGMIAKSVHTLTEREYSHKSRYLKSAINIIGALQAFALTYMPPLTSALGVGPLAFAGPAFALEELAGALSKAIDLYHIVKEQEYSGWLTSKIKEVNRLMKRVNKLNLKMLKQSSHQADRQIELRELGEKIETLIQQMISRSRVYLKDHREDNDKINHSFQQLHTNVNLEKIIDECHQAIQADDIMLDTKLSNDLKIKFKSERIDLILRVLSVIGMSLIAVSGFVGPAAPALLIPGLVLVSIVACYQIHKHRDEIKHLFQKIKKAFKNEWGELKQFKHKLVHTLFDHHPLSSHLHNVRKSYHPTPALP